MIPTSALVASRPEVAGIRPPEPLPPKRQPKQQPRKPGRTRRFLGSRFLAWSLAFVTLAATIVVAATRPEDMSVRIRRLKGEVAAATAQSEQLRDRAKTAERKTGQLASSVSDLERKLERVRASKIETVVETKTVTETVARWIPNGKGISVEVTGFEDMIRIHDVQVTHSFGYSDLIGIAVNKSGRTISYAQLGCTFLDRQGKVLANQIANKQDWAAGATWGFVCSAETDATGGIVRVDEMT